MPKILKYVRSVPALSSLMQDDQPTVYSAIRQDSRFLLYNLIRICTFSILMLEGDPVNLSDLIRLPLFLCKNLVLSDTLLFKTVRILHLCMHKPTVQSSKAHLICCEQDVRELMASTVVNALNKSSRKSIADSGHAGTSEISSGEVERETVQMYRCLYRNICLT